VREVRGGGQPKIRRLILDTVAGRPGGDPRARWTRRERQNARRTLGMSLRTACVGVFFLRCFFVCVPSSEERHCSTDDRSCPARQLRYRSPAPCCSRHALAHTPRQHWVIA
jgi:hypothetical protein